MPSAPASTSGLFVAVPFRVTGPAARETGAEMIVTTEKDAIRIPPRVSSPPVRVLRVALEITEGADVLDRLLTRMDGEARG